MNKLCFLVEDNKIKAISFDRNELTKYMEGSQAKIQEMTVLDLVQMFQTKGVQLGTDWLSINPIGYSAPIPSTSVDAWPTDGG